MITKCEADNADNAETTNHADNAAYMPNHCTVRLQSFQYLETQRLLSA
jgi:hypothetical protein